MMVPNSIGHSNVHMPVWVASYGTVEPNGWFVLDASYSTVTLHGGIENAWALDH